MKSLNPNAILLCSVIWLLAGTMAVINVRIPQPDRLYDVKVQAAKYMREASEHVKAEKVRLGLGISANDINATGLVGEPYNGMTTSVGSPEAKRTAASPDSAALVVELLDEAGAKAGDRIAINMSGSFPGFNIAIMSACKAMKLQPVVIASAGASTYGANQPLLTYIDMHMMLYESGIFNAPLVAFSMGGDYDTGANMWPEVRQEIEGRLRSYEIPFISEKDFDKNIEERLKVYDTYGAANIFVNSGGNRAGAADDFFPEGVTLPTKLISQSHFGLAESFLNRGVPVVYLLNVKGLCEKYGLPFDPSPISEIGTSAIYYSFSYSPILILIALCGGLLLLIIYKKSIKSH